MKILEFSWLLSILLLLLLLFSCILLFLIVYKYLTRNFSYWKKKGLSGPKPLPLFGNSLSAFLKPVPNNEIEWFQKYGRLYGIYEKQTPILTIGEPQLLKAILVKDFHLFSDRKQRKVNHELLKINLFNSTGDNWKRLRSIMSPTFTSSKMKKMYPTIRKCLKEFLDHLEIYAKNKDNINLKDAHGNFTMDVIANCAFATKTNAHKDQNDPFIVNAKKIVNLNFAKLVKILILLILPIFGIQSGVQSASDANANQFFMNITRHILRQRKSNPKSNEQFNDFIQLLAEAEKDREELYKDFDNEDHHVNNCEEELEVERKTFAINVVNKKLSEEEIMAQGWIFFIAGYETTASTLTFCSYELALNPEVQTRLYEEIQSAVDLDGEISYEELAKLPFLDAVISETLRMYPPVVRLDRKALSDYKLGDTGIQLTKGQVVEIPIYAIQHSEEFYPNPNCFLPDRFLPKNRHNIEPYTYLPFGSGPRNCIGMRFALMEIKLCMVQIVRRFRFFRTEKTAVPLQFKRVSLFTAAKEVVVGIEKRQY